MLVEMKVEEGDRGRICAAEPGVCDQSSSRLVDTLAVCLALCYTSFHPHAGLGEENTIFMVWPKYHFWEATQKRLSFVASCQEGAYINAAILMPLVSMLMTVMVI